MKTFSKQLLNFLLSDQVEFFYTADLFEIETSFGMKMYATDGQMPITYNGNVYEPVKYGIWLRGSVSTKLGMTSSSMSFTVMADGTPMNGNVAKWPDGQLKSSIIQFKNQDASYPGTVYPGINSTGYLYSLTTGIIIPPVSGNYVFTVLSDDLASLYVNGIQVPIKYVNNPAVAYEPQEGNIILVGGSIYDIAVTCNNDGGGQSGVAVYWSTRGSSLAFVPPAPGTKFLCKAWQMSGSSSSGGYPLNGGEVTIPNDFEIPLMQAIQQGLFDGAKITVYTCYMPDYGDLVYGVEKKYSGQITELSKTGRTTAEGTAESYLFKLNQQMPRMLMQPGCRWVLGDAGCTIDLASSNSPYIQTGVASSSSTSLQIVPQTAFTQPDGYFTQGVITMTSGHNMGLSMSVKQYKGGVLVLTRPFLFPIATGDAFQVAAGCDHTYATCQQKFNNLTNFGGMPWIPNMERAI